MVIATILLRKGSQSIPDKNVKDFCGKPLWYWQANALIKSEVVDEVWLSTNYDLSELRIKEAPDLMETGKLKVFQRSEEFATSLASSESAMMECLTNIPYTIPGNTILILAQATTPYVLPQDYRKAINLIQAFSKEVSLLSVAESTRFFWKRTEGSSYAESVNYDPQTRKMRQNIDDGGMYVENGGFYMTRSGRFHETHVRLTEKPLMYIMPEWTSVEIDEEDDWEFAEHLMRKYVLTNFSE